MWKLSQLIGPAVVVPVLTPVVVGHLPQRIEGHCLGGHRLLQLVDGRARLIHCVLGGLDAFDAVHDGPFVRRSVGLPINHFTPWVVCVASTPPAGSLGHNEGMPLFDDTISLLDLELFDAAFAISPSSEDDARRRFMTLFLHEGSERHGGSADVCKATNTRGEVFAVKRLHLPPDEMALLSGSTPSTPGTPRRKEIRHSVGSSGSAAGATPDYATSGHVAAFYEEYRIHLAVSHLRGFPQLYGFGLAGGSPLMVMEWVEGITLREAVATRGTSDPDPLPLITAARLGNAVLALLQRATELDQRFVHRDLSPRNIMLRTDRTPASEQLDSGVFDLCLIDFGSASLTTELLDASFTMNEGVWRMGTPAYAPPEMLTSDVPQPSHYRQSSKIDVYALCSILYELYADTPPFGRVSSRERSPYRLKTETTPAPLEPRAPDGGTLAAIIASGLAVRQEDRPSLQQLQAALTNWLEFPEAPAATSAQGSRLSPHFWEDGAARKAISRRRLISAAILGAGALCAGGIVWQHVASRQQPALDESRYAQTDEVYQGDPLFLAYDSTLKGWGFYTAEGALRCRLSSSRGCGPLREGLACLYDDLSQRWGFLAPVSDTDEGYAWAILPRFAQAKQFHEGLAPAQDATTRLWGYIDRTGAWALPARYKEAEPFSHGIAAVQQAEGTPCWGSISVVGDWVVPPRFATLGAHSAQGLAVAEESPGSWGIVDEQGSWSAEPHFNRLRRFSGGLAPARLTADGLWGLVDGGGSWVVEPRYADARPFCDPSTWAGSGSGSTSPLAAVQDATSLLWHFVDASGKPASNADAHLGKLGDLFDGLAPAQASFDDDVVVFGEGEDEADADAQATGAALRYGYVDATGAWQMRQLTELTNTGLGPAEI